MSHGAEAVEYTPRAEGIRVPLVPILGIPFSVLSYDAAVQRIRDMIRSDEGHHVVLANAHTLNAAYEDGAYRRTLQQASLVLRDGLGVELAALLAGVRLAHNFIGTDFVPQLLRSLADLRPGVFLYGAALGVAAEAAAVLRQRCPGVRIVGVEHGYVESASVIERIRAARPDILLVALGNPLQEQWIAAHLSELNARVAIGVGALFDYLAGRVPRAPQWVRQLRAEWLFRLAVEPRRLWRRYLVGNVQFLWRVLSQTPAHDRQVPPTPTYKRN
jgi:N-acetylglucosaminyldiphosphoundecaprenol N-acetyl-beta-D-mannosaminyltransferase